MDWVKLKLIALNLVVSEKFKKKINVVFALKSAKLKKLHWFCQGVVILFIQFVLVSGSDKHQFALTVKQI